MGLKRFPASEFDCVRGLLAAETLAEAARQARHLGVTGERCLIASGAIDEEEYLRALAASIGVVFDPLLAWRRGNCPLSDEKLILAPAAGLLPLIREGRTIYVVAPRDVRQFLAYLAERPGLLPHLRLTTPRRLQAFVFERAREAVGRFASEGLRERYPEMSAAPVRVRNLGPSTLTAALFALAVAALAPDWTVAAIEFALVCIFLGWIVLRLFGMLLQLPAASPRRASSPAELPVYSIVVALYREAASVRRLVAALNALDYPREKLEIKLVLESDDLETRAMLARLHLDCHFDVIVVPDIGPRTKPKALNAVLPLLRGKYIAVYDAEDRPDPDQLQRALNAFRVAGDDLACVQARLTIDNTDDSWLAGIYTAEYAAQFDVFLPALAALSVPLPLGGTSNHFRADVLRHVGGWDSYNVTEDADLGLRLARFGYRCDVIDSATYEEAPARFGPWLRQRTRWFKGWIKTWLVHMRHPFRLFRELGPFSFLIFQLSFGGNVVAALVHPFFVFALLHAILSDAPMLRGDHVGIAMLSGLFGAAALAGYLVSAVLNGVGLIRRGLFSTLWVVLLTPLHWMLLSMAAWRALYQLIRDPYRWEKTEHGLARTSRRRRGIDRVLEQLERQFRAARG